MIVIFTWHDYLPDPTLVDAILDFFLHNAHHFDLHGDGMRA
ncbi:MAG: ATP-binding protein [Trueperaceae bacterium]|nr:ATP-binding protein [Trueperaceae bacterium]